MGMTTTILGNYLLLMQVKTIQKHILYHQFHRLSGATLDMTVEERVKLAESLMLRFRHVSTRGRFCSFVALMYVPSILLIQLTVCIKNAQGLYISMSKPAGLNCKYNCLNNWI